VLKESPDLPKKFLKELKDAKLTFEIVSTALFSGHFFFHRKMKPECVTRRKSLLE